MKFNFMTVLKWLFMGLVLFLTLWTAVSLWFTGVIDHQQPFVLISNILTLLVPLVIIAVALLILSRMPRHAVGWLMMFLGILVILSSPAYVVVRSFSELPADPPLILFVAVWYSNIVWPLLILSVFLLALIFPTGKPATPRWRWPIRYGLFLLIITFLLSLLYPQVEYFEKGWIIQNPIGIASLASIGTGLGPMILLVLLAIPSFLSVIVRYRNGNYIERQQMKWFLLACSLFLLIVSSISLLGLDWGAIVDIYQQLFSLFFSLGLMLFPIAIGIAILRYRLFDIDLIIRKTLTYTTLSALLALTYFVTVISLQSIIGRNAGQQPPLVIVLSTLLIAAIFRPLHNRVQGLVDRRFFRRKYDAKQVLTKFSMATQDETDIDTLSNEILKVVQETIQPEKMSIWFKR